VERGLPVERWNLYLCWHVLILAVSEKREISGAKFPEKKNQMSSEIDRQLCYIRATVN
jgi:hypothetical protein